MRRWLVLLVPLLVPLLLAGCATWGQNGFDGGRSFDNRLDTSITAANVGALHEVWKLPGGTPAIGGGYVFDSLNDPSPFVRHALVAYPESGCTGSGVPTCAEAWSLDGRYSPPATDGSSVFAVNVTTNVLQVLAVDGTPEWTYAPAPIGGSTTVLGPTIRFDNGVVWLQVEDTDGTNLRTDRLVALPAAGCGASTCAATLTITGNQVEGLVAAEGTVLASRRADNHGSLAANVVAYDASSGAVQWRSSEFAIVVAARDGRAYALLTCESTGCSPGVVYPLAAGANCSGTPTVCASIASFLQLRSGPVITGQHVVVVGTDGPRWYPADCTGACSSVAKFVIPGIPDPVGYAAAGPLVFTAGSSSLNHPRIYAFDDSLSNCPGDSCVPAATISPATYVNGLAVAHGRVYASETDGVVHVYAL